MKYADFDRPITSWQLAQTIRVTWPVDALDADRTIGRYSLATGTNSISNLNPSDSLVNIGVAVVYQAFCTVRQVPAVIRWLNNRTTGKLPSECVYGLVVTILRNRVD